MESASPRDLRILQSDRSWRYHSSRGRGCFYVSLAEPSFPKHQSLTASPVPSNRLVSCALAATLPEGWASPPIIASLVLGPIFLVSEHSLRTIFCPPSTSALTRRTFPLLFSDRSSHLRATIRQIPSRPLHLLQKLSAHDHRLCCLHPRHRRCYLRHVQVSRKLEQNLNASSLADLPLLSSRCRYSWMVVTQGWSTQHLTYFTYGSSNTLSFRF